MLFVVDAVVLRNMGELCCILCWYFLGRTAPKNLVINTKFFGDSVTNTDELILKTSKSNQFVKEKIRGHFQCQMEMEFNLFAQKISQKGLTYDLLTHEIKQTIHCSRLVTSSQLIYEN